MLKSNSKEAKRKIQNYIMKNSLSAFCDDKNYLKENFADWKERFPYNDNSFPDRAKWIYKKFKAEKRYEQKFYKNEEELFESWAQGLACNGLFLHYLGNAKKIVAYILEQDAKQTEKYSNDNAEKLLTHLIYREVKQEATKK